MAVVTQDLKTQISYFISSFLRCLFLEEITDNKTYPPEEIAIRFKHRIVAIHCFPNGNGRHSRMMADVIIESVFGKEVFSWHKSNMVRADETRKNYIIALREADNGNIHPFIEFATN